jgi:pimeloyl-ACP methyl ester carboxylesterase
MPTFALIHSPLVSPFTWQSTAEALRRRGHTAVVPDLRDRPGAGPYWRQHVGAAAAALAGAALTEPVALVAHSGAGALLPSLGQALGQAVAGYLFVDAGWPAGGQSRLQSFGGPDGGAAFGAFLAGGGRFPEWQADDLAEIVPEAAVRTQLVAELRPRGLDYWNEPLPVVPGWPDAPGGYVLYTETYQPEAAQAAAQGWPVIERAAGHFEMLVHPERVADELLALTDSLRRPRTHG